MPLLNINVNGKDYSIEVEPHEYLAHVLREKLGLTGTKIGCEEAECGACTVLVNGAPVVSCIYPALKAEGAHIETIEGLARGGGEDKPSPLRLHPLQRAFIEHGAVQCGFCTPGLIMAAKGLLDHNPDPTDDDIKKTLATGVPGTAMPALRIEVMALVYVLWNVESETLLSPDSLAMLRLAGSDVCSSSERSPAGCDCCAGRDHVVYKVERQ